jgi:hypothetical protein
MKPFRNKGWNHYNLMQEILFSTAARGSHAYRPALAPATTPDESDDGKLSTIEVTPNTTQAFSSTSMAAANEIIASGLEVTIANDTGVPTESPILMDIDRHPAPTTSGKRTHSIMSFSDSQQSLPETNMTSSGINSDPVQKKRSLASQCSRDSQKNTRSKPPTGKVTQAAAMVGMQSQISRLTDVFERSMTTPEDGIAAKCSLAISHLQQVDDGLSTGEKVKLIHKFQKDPSLAQTYLDLVDDVLRQAWLRSELDDN